MSDFEELVVTNEKWALKNAADIKSLANELAGKLIRQGISDGHPLEEWEFPTSTEAANFVKAAKIFGAYKRLLHNSFRGWGSNIVTVYYRTRDKTDEL